MLLGNRSYGVQIALSCRERSISLPYALVQNGYTTMGGMRYGTIANATSLAIALERAFVLPLEEMLV